jgi:anti-sigma regulatory factor (Ser/Thr protein kinase)
VADGSPSTETLLGGFVRPTQDDRGNVLFATRAGVAVADPDQAARTLQVPVVIELTVLEDQPLDTTTRRSIPYGRTRLTFDYEGTALSEPGRVRYRVRLKGFDPEWVETGIRRTATYTALPAGEYRFQVQATLEGQAWPDAFTSLSFQIAPPYYRRWWFLLLAGLLLIGIYFLFYRLRLSAERRRFALVMAERNRLAREVHDTLAQDLVSTGIQLDVVLFALKHQTLESAVQMLSTLRRSVGQALAEARESIGDLRNPALRFDLESRLRRTVERKSTKTVSVTMEVSGTLKPLTSGMEMELLRITSEAIDNAVRHANATSVAVRVRSNAGTLEITVADDGLGFIPADAEAMSGHYGLRGMRERAEAIGATLSIASKAGAGTTILVSVEYR